MTIDPCNVQIFLLHPCGLILDNFCLSRLGLWLTLRETVTKPLEGLWSLLLWRYSNSTWTWSCATRARWLCFDRGLDWM